MQAKREVEGGDKGFGDGLLVDLVAALRETADGDVLALTTPRDDVLRDVGTWSRLTGNAIVASTTADGIHRLLVRKGQARFPDEPARAIGSRLWLYSNFDCNLRCDYCCVRSSPTTPRRPLGLERVRRIADEARALGVASIFVTGGEPFLLKDIGEILEACAAAAPTTLLTNGMLFTGSRLALLSRLPKDRIVLQISVDSPNAGLHDLHRGKGSWDKAIAGVRLAREHGFRVRLAATVSTDREEENFRAFLDREAVDEDDRVIRRVAARGFATDGVAISKSDLVPEVTLTDSGVFWHPVGADDDDFLVTTSIFPLADAIAAVRAHWDKERELHDSIADIFRCA